MQHQKHVYIIAEAGVNHNGSVEMAKQLIIKAAEAGADAVKFQTFQPELLASAAAPKAAYQKTTTDAAESQLAMLKQLELPRVVYPELLRLCTEKKIAFLSTPFEADSLGFLVEACRLPIIKIPSGEITNAPFLLDIAHTHKPVILSTGMSNMGEIEAALGVLAFGYLKAGQPVSSDDFTAAYASVEGQALLQQYVRLLHCTTAYPAPLDSVNLRAMDTMRETFHLPVGYSDHTAGISIALAAAARGAVIIEKHFTLDRTLPGPDHQASLEPDALFTMVQGIRQIEQAMGNGIKTANKLEIQNKKVVRKSILAGCDIQKGESFQKDNLVIKRPGDGLSPFAYWDLLGVKALRAFKRDEKVRW